jgi:hypothetical protein
MTTFLAFLSAITGLQWLAIYLVGFLVTFTFFAIFGRKLGINNYDGPKTYANYDDYSSNAQAFVTWSLAWPVVWFFGSIFGAFNLLTFLASLVVPPYKPETKTETDE